MFTKPVPASFVNAWRDFEENWSETLEDVRWVNMHLDAGIDVGGDLLETSGSFETKQEKAWRIANFQAEGDAASVARALDFALDNALQEHREFGRDEDEHEEFVQEIKDAAVVWDRLKNASGFDLQGVLRRRRLVPFVNIPSHVAKHHGGSDKQVFYQHLQQAHEAFVYGIPFAAFALMRALLELVLRKHYDSSDCGLHARIHRAEKFLPNGARMERLLRLTDRADTILHSLSEVTKLSLVPAADLEKDIVSFLHALRTLIEKAPQGPRHGQASKAAR